MFIRTLARSMTRCSLTVAFLLACVLGSWLPGTLAQTPTDPPAAKPATVTFQNREIAVLRATLLGYTPEQRAEAVRARLQNLAQQGGLEEKVTARPMTEGVLIEVGGKGILVIAPGDVNTLAGETVESVSQGVVGNLTLALAESREQRSLAAMVRAAGAVAAATAIFLLLTWGLIRVARRLARRVQALAVALVGHLRVGEHVAVTPEPVGRAARGAVVLAGWAIGFFLAYLWLGFSLARFPYTRPWGEQLQGFLLHVLATVANGIVGAIPGLVFVVVIVLIARALTRAVTAFTQRVESGRVAVGWLDPDVALPTRRIANTVLWLFALVMAYPYLPGSDSEAFKGLSVLVGLMITIGASGVIGQAASGLIIVYSRALRRGEYVRIGDTEGTVTDLGVFATHVRTGLGEEIVLPNAYVVSNTTKNYSRVLPDRRGFVLDTTVTIGYSTPWRQVHAMLLEAARRTQGLLDDPKPFVAQTALSDFYVEYRLVCYAGPEAPQRRALVLSALHTNIQDVFNEHGVQIMSPHYMMDPAQPQVVPKEKWYEPPAQQPGA